MNIFASARCCRSPTGAAAAAARTSGNSRLRRDLEQHRNRRATVNIFIAHSGMEDSARRNSQLSSSIVNSTVVAYVNLLCAMCGSVVFFEIRCIIGGMGKIYIGILRFTRFFPHGFSSPLSKWLLESLACFDCDNIR